MQRLKFSIKAMRTLKPDSETMAEITVHRSRFLSFGAHVQSESQARDFIAEVRSRHPQSRHVCTAFRVRTESGMLLERSSDDGEPSGTAGRPILQVLTGEKLENIVVAVVRYFGGVKLGTGGLVRAYQDVTMVMLQNAPIGRQVRWPIWTVTLPAFEAGRVESHIRSSGFQILETKWGSETKLQVAVKPGEEERLDEQVSELTGRHAGIEETETTFTFFSQVADTK